MYAEMAGIASGHLCRQSHSTFLGHGHRSWNWGTLAQPHPINPVSTMLCVGQFADMSGRGKGLYVH